MQTYDDKHGNYKKMTLNFDSIKVTGTSNHKNTFDTIHPNNPEANSSEVLSDKNEQIDRNESMVLSFRIKN